MNQNAKFDQNFDHTITAITDDVLQEIRRLLVDPVTGALKVMAVGSTILTVYTETPSGLINGNNKVYTVLHSINNIFSFAINGEYIDSAEYSVAGNQITFGTALPSVLSGLPFEVKYN